VAEERVGGGVTAVCLGEEGVTHNVIGVNKEGKLMQLVHVVNMAGINSTGAPL
jgi:hypothetical protein